MNHHQTTALPAVATPDQARALGQELIEVMTALLAVIERETELVRAGKVAEAIKLDVSKTALSRRYLGTVSQLKASQTYLSATVPELLTALQRHHDMFRGLLQVNLTVLATAHAVSEGIVRGVNTEIQKRNSPQTYTERGIRATPPNRTATPLALSRTL
jgi:hypothetical protein